MRYKQCEFRRGDSRTVGWIPAWAAVVGNSVQLLDSAVPERFWSIFSVSAIEMDGKTLRRQEGCLEYEGMVDTLGNDTLGEAMAFIRRARSIEQL